MNNSIWGKAFISLISLFWFVGICYMLFTDGEYFLSLDKTLTLIKNDFDTWDFYKKVVVWLTSENQYNAMSKFQQNFYFSNSIYTFFGILEPLGQIWIIGPFIQGFMNMLVTSLAMIFILLDILLHIISYLMTIVMIIFDIMANLGGTRVLSSIS